MEELNNSQEEVKKPLNLGISQRQEVYQFLTPNFIFCKIAKLSKFEREFSKSELKNFIISQYKQGQAWELKIKPQESSDFMTQSQISYMIEFSNSNFNITQSEEQENAQKQLSYFFATFNHYKTTISLQWDGIWIDDTFQKSYFPKQFKLLAFSNIQNSHIDVMKNDFFLKVLQAGKTLQFTNCSIIATGINKQTKFQNQKTIEEIHLDNFNEGQMQNTNNNSSLIGQNLAMLYNNTPSIFGRGVNVQQQQPFNQNYGGSQLQQPQVSNTFLIIQYLLEQAGVKRLSMKNSQLHYHPNSQNKDQSTLEYLCIENSVILNQNKTEINKFQFIKEKFPNLKEFKIIFSSIIELQNQFESIANQTQLKLLEKITFSLKTKCYLNETLAILKKHESLPNLKCISIFVASLILMNKQEFKMYHPRKLNEDDIIKFIVAQVNPMQELTFNERLDIAANQRILEFTNELIDIKLRLILNLNDENSQYCFC